MTAPPRIAIIIPACDEGECIGAVLAELGALLDPQSTIVCVGVNGSSDATSRIAREHGAHVAETALRGYGHGCQAAIDALTQAAINIDAYVFVAADGANDPRDIAALVAEFRAGATMVLGCRTRTPSNWTRMNWHYVLANRFFGAFCGVLTGRCFADLGPLRLIERELFERLELREWTYGWTIAAQIRAAMLGAKIVEIPVVERPRLAGAQKVSHVSWRRTLAVGVKVIVAGFRTRAAWGARPPSAVPQREPDESRAAPAPVPGAERS